MQNSPFMPTVNIVHLLTTQFVVRSARCTDGRCHRKTRRMLRDCGTGRRRRTNDKSIRDSSKCDQPRPMCRRRFCRCRPKSSGTCTGNTRRSRCTWGQTVTTSATWSWIDRQRDRKPITLHTRCPDGKAVGDCFRLQGTDGHTHVRIDGPPENIMPPAHRTERGIHRVK